jgi:hypothetical protein
MLHVDIPNQAQLLALTSLRADMAVSIYLPTTPLTQDAQADRVALKNHAKEAIAQLHAANADKRRVAQLEEHLDDLVDDDEFWAFQARSLAVLATPDGVQSFRLPSAHTARVEVSDRFHMKPLLRAQTFPNACHVLALAANDVRLVAVSADLPAGYAKVDGMPKDAASAVGKASILGRSASGRVHGSEGHKVRLAQFARQVDRALMARLHGSHLPLVLAANEPLATTFRSLSTHPHLAAETIGGNSETMSDAELAEKARGVLDKLYAAQLAEWRDTYALRANQGRATADIAQAARAATMGAIDSLMVDIDDSVPGTIDEAGVVSFAAVNDAVAYGVVDEIASRVLLSGGRVLAVRRADIPGTTGMAAILRFPV